MKLITLSIDKRASHVINFERSNETDKPVDTYIITKSDDTELLTFYHGEATAVGGFAADMDEESRPKPRSSAKNDDGTAAIVLQTSQGQRTAYIQSIDCQEDGDGNLSLSIGLTTERVTLLPVSPRLSFIRQADSDQWVLTLRELPDEPVMIRVTLTFCEPDIEPIEKELMLCVAPSADIADVVLDFGSEASQMAIFDQNPMDIDGIQPIFEDMKELLLSPPNLHLTPLTSPSNERYVQQDIRDANLFKSIFYAKTKVDAEATPIPMLDAVNGILQEDKTLSMMTTESEAQALQQNGEYIQMPNVKISGFGGVREPRVGGRPISKFRDGFFYRSTINRFILGAFTKVDCDGQPKCVRLNVLMPNVYTHNDVQSRLKWMKKDIATMLATNEKLAGCVRCCEVIVVSESDASLLGALDLLTHPDNPRPLAPGKYLIMDAGKGTLDFSIVEYRNGEVVSRFRSGIIGAGNAMSYAYMLGLLHDFFIENTITQQVRDEDLQQWIFSKVLLGDDDSTVDTAKLRRLMETVDQYKIAVSNGHPDYTITATAAVSRNTRSSTSFSQLDFETFISYVAQMTEGTRFKPLSKNAQKYVDAMSLRIASDVARSLSIAKAQEFSNIRGVFFAGRAFRDKLLKAAIFNRLKADGIVQQELEYLDEDHYAFNQKNICLYIRSHLQRGVTSNRMLSTPFARVRRKQQLEQQSKNRGGGLLGTIGRGWSRITKRAPEVLNAFGDAFTGYDTDDDAFFYDYVAAMAPVNGMVYGYDLEINDTELDWILIGGTYYRPTSSGHLKLFYSDDRIFVRAEGAQPITKELMPDATYNMRFSSLTFATLFPYVNAHFGEMNKVFIPKADKTTVSTDHLATSIHLQDGSSATTTQGTPKPAGILLGDPMPGKKDIDEYEALARQIKN